MKIQPWIRAARLRTLPLALSTMICGHSLAYDSGIFRWDIAILSILTAISLQVLSNFANDYGDTIHGADHDGRQGPTRAVQSGDIALSQMKNAVDMMAVISFLIGITLVLISFDSWILRLAFVVVGVMAIWAAINYTAGSTPYGYSGKGDIAVFIFFGCVTVIGSYYLQTQTFAPIILLPAMACGLLSVGVLNVNNIRDMTSDMKAGKLSIPIKIGRSAAITYHGYLLTIAVLCLILYGYYRSFGVSLKWVFLIPTPLLFDNYRAVKYKVDPQLLDPYLRQLALTTASIVLLFSIGLVIG